MAGCWSLIHHFLQFRGNIAELELFSQHSGSFMGNLPSLYSRNAVLRTFALIVTAHPYCARKFECHVMHRARALSTKKNNDTGQVAIAMALLGFYDVGRSVIPTFLFRNGFYLQLSPHCPKINKKALWEVKKKFKVSAYETWNPAILRLQGAWNYGH